MTKKTIKYTLNIGEVVTIDKTNFRDQYQKGSANYFSAEKRDRRDVVYCGLLENKIGLMIVNRKDYPNEQIGPVFFPYAFVDGDTFIPYEDRIYSLGPLKIKFDKCFGNKIVLESILEEEDE